MNFVKDKFGLKNKEGEGVSLKLPLIIILVFIMIYGFLGNTSLRMLFNLNSIVIILSGILISLIMSFSVDVLIITVQTIISSFKDEIDFEKTIEKIYNLSIKVKKDGLLSLKDEIPYEEDVFIRDAMVLLNDYKSTETIEDIIDHDIESRYMELLKPYRVMEMVFNLAPAFGLIGTLLGMIGLLPNITDPSLIMGNMASALVSTLYGTLIANLIAFPLMARINEYNGQQLLEYRMIKEGILLISKDDSTRNVFDKMNVMLREENRMVYPRYTEVAEDSIWSEEV